MYIGAIIIGCVTGFLSAFFGIGGSSIDTPLLRLFLHLSPYLALGTPLPTALLTVAIALVVYHKKNLVDYRVFGWSILGGLPSIILGSYLSQFFSGQFLMLFAAVILFFVGIDFIARIFQNQKKNGSEQGKTQKKAGKIVTISALAGLFSGILAIGGGLFMIPAYTLFLQMKMKEAIATSLLTVGVLIIPAGLIHFGLGHIDLGISFAMGCGVVPMAYLGAKADLKTKSATVSLLFGFLLVIFSILFFFSQM
jgi:uncharacterized protein